MSFEERVEVLRHAYDVIDPGDPKALEPWHPEITIIDPTRPDPTSSDGAWHGHAGLARYVEDWAEAFENTWTEVEEFVEAGDGMVACCLVRSRARASGIEVENRRYHATRFRDGQVVWLGIYADLDEAVAAARG